MAGAGFNVPGVKNCADPCVKHLRFANDEVGYAYGDDAFFMTNDGGRSWSPEKGGAILLESLDNNVDPGDVQRHRMPRPVRRPGGDGRGSVPRPGPKSYLGPLSGADVALSRGGSAALPARPAQSGRGRAGPATSTLYSSTDDGRHWRSAGEPCPQGAHEVDSVAVTAAPAGRVSVLCTERSAGHGSFVATSTDAGRHFARQPGTVPAATADLLTGDATTVLVTGGTGLARSTDGGASWRRRPDVSGEVSFIGFESRPSGGR